MLSTSLPVSKNFSHWTFFEHMTKNDRNRRYSDPTDLHHGSASQVFVPVPQTPGTYYCTYTSTRLCVCQCLPVKPRDKRRRRRGDWQTEQLTEGCWGLFSDLPCVFPWVRVHWWCDTNHMNWSHICRESAWNVQGPNTRRNSTSTLGLNTVVVFNFYVFHLYMTT